MGFTVAKFRDVADGRQPGQFEVGDHQQVRSLSDLDPVYRQLLDAPVAAVTAVIGGDGRANLTPMWFDYDGDTVLMNLATHRKKVEWIRKTPQMTLLLVNPQNMYHWVSLHVSVTEEILEDDPERGHLAAEQLDRIWTKYTGNEPPYGLRDPAIDERRLLLLCSVDRVATFGRP